MCQYNKMFSHVYVEKGVAEHPRTKQILEKLNNTTVIEIDHYKDCLLYTSPSPRD